MVVVTCYVHVPYLGVLALGHQLIRSIIILSSCRAIL